jgi:hypothetical protein
MAKTPALCVSMHGHMETIVKAIALLAMFLAQSSGAAFSRDLSYIPGQMDCPPEEPDSVQVSWAAPCENDNWLLDTEAGCRMWDWHPDPNDRAIWNGACRFGLKEGIGSVQWFEHGEPIDRFEGAFHAGVREGFGHYTWNADNWFRGIYAKNRPHGPGTAYIASIEFSGRWQNGCLRNGDKVVAIGVPLTSCLFLEISEASLAAP